MEDDLIHEDEAKHQAVLVERALGAENFERKHDALAEGMLAYGMRFIIVLRTLANLEREEYEGDRFQRLLHEASDLFIEWLGGKQISDRVDEDERRILALAVAVEQSPRLGRLAAGAILRLPNGHPLRDVDRARRLLENHLEIVRAEGDAEGEVMTIGSVLQWDIEGPERSLELIEEGLANSEGLEDQEVIRDFRLAVAAYYGYRAIKARDDRDESAHRDWASRALAVLGPEAPGDAPLSEEATRSALVVALSVAVADEEPNKAAALFGRIVDSPNAPPHRASIAAMHEGRIRFRVGDYRRAADVLAAHDAFFEEAYLTAVTDADIASTGSDFADVISNLAFARAYLDEWDLAVQTLDRGKSLRFRHRAAMRETESGRELLELERLLHAVTRGVPIESAAAVDRAADMLAQGVLPEARMQEAYRRARPRVAAEVLRTPRVEDIGAALAPGEAAVLFGVSWRATMVAAVLPHDAGEPSGRWLLEDWPKRRWVELFAGANEDGWLYAVRAPELGLDAGGALEKLLAGVDEALRGELSPFLAEHEIRRLVVVPHGWLHLVPFWATTSLTDYDVLMAPSAAQLVRARGQETTALRGPALVVSNPSDDLPVAAAEAESVEASLHGMRLATSRLHGPEATEDKIASVLARGVSVFHFSGHGRSDMFQATRSALLLHPSAEPGVPEGQERLDAALAAAGDWQDADEEARFVDVPGIGRLSERRALGSPLVERTLDYSEHGTLWAEYDGEDLKRVAELWTAGDIMVDEALAGCGLAVLSACDSGTTQLGETADEYAGLPAAIELAGARTVVSTLWPIDDAVTALHVDLLYQAFAAHTGDIDVAHTVRKVEERVRSLPRAEAVDLVEELRLRTTDPIGRFFLERLKRDLEQGVEFPFARPFVWATFYVTGDGRIRVEHDDHA